MAMLSCQVAQSLKTEQGHPSSFVLSQDTTSKEIHFLLHEKIAQIISTPTLESVSPQRCTDIQSGPHFKR